MRPVTTQTRRTHKSFFGTPTRDLWQLLALCLIVASVPVVVCLRVASERSVTRHEASAAIDPDRTGHVSVHAADRGKPFLNLQDGREMSVMYRGNEDAVAALQNHAALSRSLASADFDRNGTPDVVAGYGYSGGGLITLQRGNPDAFAPASDAVFARLQQGYDPAPLLPWADVYRIPVTPDFLVTGDFTRDSDKDVLVAARDGGLYLLAGDGRGGLDAPQRIALPGTVTALAAGQFRAADLFTDIAVGVSGSGGHVLLIFDGAATGFTNAVVQQPLTEPASAIEFGGLDDDPFMDVAAATGKELLILHGWGRKTQGTAASRIEHVNVGMAVRGLAVGEFVWDREGHSEIAALSEDGAIQILQNATSDARPFTAAEAAERTRGRFHPAVMTRVPDVESLPAWQRGPADGWRQARWLPAGDEEETRYVSARPLLTSRLSYREINDLIVVGGGQPALEVVHPTGPRDRLLRGTPVAEDFPSTILDTESAPVAVLALPRKLNGVTDVLMLSAASSALSVIPSAPNTTIHVDRTDDNALALTCVDAVPNDCSVRGAFAFANNVLNNNTTIVIPAGTYILSINGASTDGCSDNSTGDLSVNQSMTVTGAGAASTIIRQTGTGPANDGDRVMCLAENFALDLVFNFSAFTITGGRDGASGGSVQVFGGGGIIGGEKGNALTLTNMILSNNQTVGAGLGGGAIEITGGDLTITNSTIGGTSAPGTYADRSTVANANSSGTSGAGVSFTPSAPMHTGGTGILTVTGSTFSRNVANSVGAGGGGADLYVLSFAFPGGIGTGSANFGGSTVFQNNQAVPGNGGAIIDESLDTTVSNTSFTNNSAGNRGGAIYVGGGTLGLLLDGTTFPVTMSGNTAGAAGSSVSTAFTTTVQGTNTVIGGDIEVTTGGSWINSIGSTLAPTNIVLSGGTLKMNNSTMNVGGNLVIGPAAIVGATFTGDSGTVNIAGNLTFTPGGSGPATSFNAGTGTFNFNGTGAQSISNGASITFNNLTDSNVTQPLTLNNSLAVNGSLNVNGANAILSPVAAAIISGTGTLTGTGTARASRIAATPDFLSQYTLTNKTLTNLAVDYNGAGAQTVNNTPAYSRLVISGSGTKTLQGNTTITGNLTINPSTLASGNFNFSLGGNWTNSGTFTPGTGTVTFAGTTGTQTLAGNTTFFNLTLNNSGATTNFGTATTTIGNDLTATAGTMDGGASTIIFTGVTDNAGAIAGAGPKNFHTLQINSPAIISHSAGGNITIENNYANAGTFSQGAALTTIFDVDNSSDGAHTLSGAGSTTFGNVTINNANTVDGGTHSFNVIGAAFTSTGTFTGNADTVSFNGGGAQSITGNGAKNFAGLLINNANGVQVVNGTGAVDASVAQVLTLTTDLTVASGAILQQSGTSAGAADAIGTVRRTDLGAVERAFGNLNNSVAINSGTPPTQLDLNLVKAAPGTFPAAVKVVPRDITLTPTGGGGISATVKLRYVDPGELTGPGVTESRLVLWKDIGGVWTPQGGAVNAAGNFVSLGGVSAFSEWAIAEGSDLTLSKANNVSGSAVTGQAWNWTLTASNSGAPATFAAGQTILSDNLPNSNLTYGTPTVQNVSNVSGSGNISCSIVAGDLTCTANGGSVTFDSNVGASSFDVVVSATPQASGTYQNPRTGGGIAQIDPNNAIAESNESNNSPTTNTVTVGKAGTTTTIASDNPDPSVVGQPVTVQWSVTVNSPGSVATALTGNVTVSDGTNQCVAAVSAGQCDVTFTSAGAKNLTATYAGDGNYNGSASSPVTAHTVNKADTTTTITSDNPDPSTPGQSVTVQWTVIVNAPGAGTPTGNVTVTVSGGAETCSAAAASGQCSLVLTGTGSRTITATYAGDTNFNTSSDTEDHAVCNSTVVTTNADSGAGSLRQIVAGVCDGATITFDSAGVFSTPQTISLTTGEILVDNNLTIKAGSSQVTISGNSASRAFHINPGRTFSLIGLTFTGGSSANGGAILNDGTLTIVDSTLAGNASTADGGAISNSATGALTLINTTISGNNASGNGGGVSVLGGTMTSINSTITNNRADNDNNATGTGGGIAASSGTTTLKNTIVAGNFNEDGASDAADDISGTVDPASSFNLVGTGGSGGLTDGVNNNQVSVADAGLGPLTDNGGRTQTHALLATSPAVEAGSNANLPADAFDLDGDANTGETLPVDQRGAGFPRVADSADANSTPTVDIGAFELLPTIEDIGNKTTAEDTALPQFSFNIGDGTGALIASVTAASSNTALIPNANLVINGTGSARTLDVTPAANANTPSDGTATITVTVTATNGRTATDTFDVTVTEVNDPPAPANDTIGDIVEDCASGCSSGKYVIPFATLLGNDTNKGAPDESGQTLTITAVGSPTGGTVAINGTNVEFTPTADFSGAAGFTYTVTDNGTTNGANDFKNGNAAVSFNVTAVNDNPAVTANTGITVITGSTSNTITSAMLSVTDVDNTAAQLTFTVGTAPVNGTLRKSGGALGSGGTFTQQDINGNLITYDHNGSATTTDSFNFTVSDGAGGSIGTTTFAITVTSQPSPNMSVQDSQLAEPASGTANMLFTVTLSAPAPATATVNYTTADLAPPAPNHATGGGACGAVDYVTTSGVLTFNNGEQFKTIAVPICADVTGEPNEMFELKLSGAANATLVDAQGIGTILATNQAGTLLISELRTSGPGGAADGFVEIYNNADTPLTVAASDASGGYGLYKQGATCDATPVLIATLPNGTVIPARGHYLVVGSQYSLTDYGGTNAATGNVTMSPDIESDKNVAVFSTADVAAISSANRLDAVGFGTNTGNVCDLLREGTNLGAVSGSATQHTFFRKECAFVGGVGCTVAGTPKDTNDNSADLMFADTQGTFIPGIQQSLGAPGPQNLTSPLKRDLQDLGIVLLDTTASNAAAPNRSRDFTVDPANNSTFGTLTIRRRVLNSTGAPVTRLRFRVVEITTFPSPAAGVADLRPRTSVDEVSMGPVNDAATCAATGTPATPPCSVLVKGLTLETPPAQPNGGGYNSTLSAGTITLVTPLAAGASVNVKFLLGIQATGSFRYLIIVEALP